MGPALNREQKNQAYRITVSFHRNLIDIALGRRYSGGNLRQQTQTIECPDVDFRLKLDLQFLLPSHGNPLGRLFPVLG